MAEHRDPDCWCEDYRKREARLDEMYPDRCQLHTDPDTPALGGRACVWPAGHPQPCRFGLERPGDPCHTCGTPTSPNPGSTPGCPACWTDLSSTPIADVKALFAGAAPDLSLDPEVTHG